MYIILLMQMKMKDELKSNDSARSARVYGNKPPLDFLLVASKELSQTEI